MRGWARVAATSGIAAISVTTEVTHHQPIALYLIGLAGWIESLLPDALRHGDAALNALIKTPFMLADIATAGLLAWAAREQGVRTQMRVAALYVFNPGVWYVSAYWAQSDSVYSLFLLATIISLSAGALRLAWASYCLAFATKLQSIFLAPLVLLTSALRANVRAALTAAALAATGYIVLTAPWWATGHAEAFVRGSSDPIDDLTASAYNLWYLVHLGRVSSVSAHAHPLGSPISYTWLSLLLLGGFGLFVLAVAWRQGKQIDPSLPAVLLALAPFVLLVDMHERYLLPALPLVLWCAVRTRDAGVRRQLWWCYGLLTFMFFYNVVTVGSFAPRLWTNLFALSPPYAAHILVMRAFALVAAAINVGVLVWLTGLLVQTSRVELKVADELVRLRPRLPA
jgi:Gpi18-like mannosyltransferase